MVILMTTGDFLAMSSTTDNDTGVRMAWPVMMRPTVRRPHALQEVPI